MDDETAQHVEHKDEQLPAVVVEQASEERQLRDLLLRTGVHVGTHPLRSLPSEVRTPRMSSRRKTRVPKKVMETLPS